MISRVDNTSKVVKANNISHVTMANGDTKVIKAEQDNKIAKANAQVKVVNSKMRSDIMDTTRFVYGEAIVTDGVTKLFTLALPYVSGLLEIFVDGSSYTKITEWEEVSPALGTFQFVAGQDAPDTDEHLKANYIKAV